MAITATFKADFSSFSQAVAKAEVELKSFEDGAGKVGTSLTRMANSLSGTKIIQDATLMTEAVERIGGVTMLTDRELQKLGNTANEAVEKMKKLGMDIPPGIQKIADASNAATKSAFDWRAALSGVAGMLGVAFSVNALKNFAIGVIETGAAIGDLSQKLGVSTEAVQRWTFAAEQSGATMDNVDKALSTMNRTLSAGGTGTKDILQDIGLRFDEIRKMRPEDAFNAITEAISKIEDPMLRAEAATKLFGKSGQELLPAIADGFAQVGKSARVMSEDTIKRLKEAEDAWARLSHMVTVHTGEIIAETFRVTSSWKDMVIGLAVPSFLRDNVRQALGGIYDTTESLTGALAKVPPAALAMSAGLKPIAISGTDVDTVITKMNASIANSALALNLVEPKVGSLDKAIKGFKENNESMNTSLRFTSEVIGELPPKFDKVAESVNKVATSIQKVNQIQSASVAAGDTTNEERWMGWNAPQRPPPILSGSAVAGTGSGSGATVNNNFNGILLSNDPAAKEQINQLVTDSVGSILRASGMRV